MRYLLLFVLFFYKCAPNNTSVTEKKIHGKVVKIIDGDTFDLLTDGNHTVRIRMYGIDCPERRQDFYSVCKDALAGYIFGKEVSLVVRDTDYWKRTVADVFLGGEYINLRMVENGYAWHFTKYSKNSELAVAEKNARHNKSGLWSMKNPVAPWEYRRTSAGKK